MRWPVFLLITYVFMALDKGLAVTWSIGEARPDLLLILLVFVGLCAGPASVLWGALVLGLLADLTSPVPAPDGIRALVIIGPACLGYLMGGYTALQMRGIVFRDSPITVAAMVLLAGMFAHLVQVALLSVRGLPWMIAEPIAGWDPADQLVARFFGLIYTAAVAIPIAYALLRTGWIWGFPHHPGPSGRRWRRGL